MVAFFNLKILIVFVSPPLEKELVLGTEACGENSIQICKGASTLKVGNWGAKAYTLDTTSKQLV